MAITGTVTRGSIVWMRLSPQAGHEQAGLRPAIVLSDRFIDPINSSFAFIVAVTNQVKRYPFEVPVPLGISTSGSRVTPSELTGVVLTDQAKTLDLNARDAEVIGQNRSGIAFLYAHHYQCPIHSCLIQKTAHSGAVFFVIGKYIIVCHTSLLMLCSKTKSEFKNVIPVTMT